MHHLEGLQQDVLVLGWSRSRVSTETWLKQPHCALQEFLVAEGKQLEDGTRDDPTLDRFEAEIAKYRAVQEEIQALPTSATIGYIKIDAKPIKQALTTWVTKWIYLFTHYLQIKVTPAPCFHSWHAAVSTGIPISQPDSRVSEHIVTDCRCVSADCVVVGPLVVANSSNLVLCRW